MNNTSLSLKGHPLEKLFCFLVTVQLMTANMQLIRAKIGNHLAATTVTETAQ